MRPELRLSRLALAAAVLAAGASGLWLLNTITRQNSISGLYIEKPPCGYRSEKNLIIFMDDRAVRSLKRFRININSILLKANEVWKENGIRVRYGAGSVRFRSWDTFSEECRFRDAKFSDESRCLANEMGPKSASVRKQYDPDILIFITASGIEDMSGKSFWKAGQGNGTIVLNLGINLNKYDSDERVRGVANNFYRKRFAQLLVHENAHLYGIPHSSESNSIMKNNIDGLGGHKMRIDRESKQALLEITGHLEMETVGCAARK